MLVVLSVKYPHVKVLVTADKSLLVDREQSDARHQQGVGNLILIRRENENIRIGTRIVVTICMINGGRVQLGITADKSIPVDREEVYLRKLRERG